jgi:hypothetical protein
MSYFRAELYVSFSSAPEGVFLRHLRNFVLEVRFSELSVSLFLHPHNYFICFPKDMLLELTLSGIAPLCR